VEASVDGAAPRQDDDRTRRRPLLRGEGIVLGALLGFAARDLGLVEMASAWIPGAAAGAVLAGFGWNRLLRATVAATAVLWLAAAFTPLTAWVVKPLVRDERPVAADAVVVLGSRLQMAGEPTSTALSRMLRALELVHAGHSTRIVVTEAAPPAPSHAQATRRQLERLGLAAEVESLGPVRSTREEALQTAALCRENGWQKLLVVTSPTHSRRACAALEAAGMRVVCVPARESDADLDTLDRPAERLEAFRLAIHEWLGLGLYRARGWVGVAPSR
jgi:uncharacterized SAM-binding protein YcdF (DUF218 family)